MSNEPITQPHSNELKKTSAGMAGRVAAAAAIKPQEIFKLLIESVTDYAIFAVDKEGYILTWNAGAQRLKGYRADEIIGKHISAFYTEADIQRQHPQEELKIAFQNGRYEEEGWRVRKDGSQFWANIILTKLHDEAGNFVGFAKVTRDLTERKNAENQLRELNETLERKVVERTMELSQLANRLESAVQARDEFLSIASHELKTPLTSLILQNQIRFRSVVKNGEQALTPEKVEKFLADDKRQLNRLNRLVDDMLDITRIVSGRLVLNAEPTSLGTIVFDTVERFTPQLEIADCPISLTIDYKVKGLWDPYRIEQVFTNLLTNAMKYGEKSQITIRVYSAGDCAVLEVQDQGIGIAPKDQERIFQQFERAIPANEISGLGLGLFIVQQIVEAHRGKISVSSEIGKGSCFTVKLPRLV